MWLLSLQGLENQLLYGIAVNPARAIQIDTSTDHVTDIGTLTTPQASQGVEYGVSAVDGRRSIAYFIAYNTSGTYLCGYNFNSNATTQPTLLDSASVQVFGMHYNNNTDTLVVLLGSQVVMISAGSTFARVGSSPLPTDLFPVEGGVTAYDSSAQALFFVSSDNTGIATYITAVQPTTGTVIVHSPLNDIEIISMQFDSNRSGDARSFLLRSIHNLFFFAASSCLLLLGEPAPPHSNS